MGQTRWLPSRKVEPKGCKKLALGQETGLWARQETEGFLIIKGAVNWVIFFSWDKLIGGIKTLIFNILGDKSPDLWD